MTRFLIWYSLCVFTVHMYAMDYEFPSRNRNIARMHKTLNIVGQNFMLAGVGTLFFAAERAQSEDINCILFKLLAGTTLFLFGSCLQNYVTHR